MYTLYKITNVLNNSVYIGYTSETIQQRFKRHVASANQQRCDTHILYKAFKKYGIENFSIEEVGRVDTKGDAYEYEITLIEQNRSNRMHYPNEKGYNMNDGGCGGAGYKHTEHSLVIMREKASLHKHTDETKRKISEANKGRKVSEFAKHRASVTHKGKALTEEHKRVLSQTRSRLNQTLTPEDRQKLSKNAATARKVTQHTLDGQVLHTFDQIKLAAEHVGLSVVAISNACRGKWKTAGGYVWKYAE